MLDTNVILRDLRARITYRTPTFLMQNARVGTFRLFAAINTREEVNEKLPQFLAQYQIPETQAYACWINEYGSLIRFVEVPVVHQDDPRVRFVAARDPDDLSTAVLSVLLAPSVLLSSDEKHLGRAGLAATDWFPLVEGGLAVARGDAVAVGGSLVLSAAIHGVGAIARGMGTLWRSRPAVAAALVAGLAVLAARKRNDPRFGRAVGVLRNLASTASGGLLETMGVQQAALGTLEQRTVKPAAEQSLVDHIFHTLAIAPRPLARTSIVRALLEQGISRKSLDRATNILLTGLPSFAQYPSRTVGSWGWDLRQARGQGSVRAGRRVPRGRVTMTMYRRSGGGENRARER